MRKVLLALMAVIIIGFGYVGYSSLHEDPAEVIDEKDKASTEIQL